MRHAGAIGLMLAALAIGLGLPDIDQPLALGHRSALTHAVWLPLLLAAWRQLRAFAGALSCGIAVHLDADLFPRSMRGYATIHVPGIGGIGDWSYAWIAVHAVAALALGMWLVRRHLPPGAAGAATLVIGIGLALAYLARDAAAIPALLLAIGCGWALRRAIARPR